MQYQGAASKETNIETMTIRELGDLAARRGVRPSVILAEYELRRAPSARGE